VSEEGGEQHQDTIGKDNSVGEENFGAGGKKKKGSRWGGPKKKKNSEFRIKKGKIFCGQA